MPTSPHASSSAETRRLVNVVAVVAAIDFALLLPLLYGSLTDDHGIVAVLGPLHGVGFLIELGLTVWGWMRRMWGWWFPVAVIVTLGPLGALIGHRKVMRDCRASELAERV